MKLTTKEFTQRLLDLGTQLDDVSCQAPPDINEFVVRELEGMMDRIFELSAMFDPDLQPGDDDSCDPTCVAGDCANCPPEIRECRTRWARHHGLIK